MGHRGPAPLPSNVKNIRGTYRADRAAPNEVKPKSEIPSCPRWLDKNARKEWRRITKELKALGVISKLDVAALAGYCEAFAEMQLMTELIEKNGRTFITDKGYVGQRPEVSIKNKAADRMRAFLKEFGLSPSSRTRVSVPKNDDEVDNPFRGVG